MNNNPIMHNDPTGHDGSSCNPATDPNHCAGIPTTVPTQHSVHDASPIDASNNPKCPPSGVNTVCVGLTGKQMLSVYNDLGILPGLLNAQGLLVSAGVLLSAANKTDLFQSSVLALAALGVSSAVTLTVPTLVAAVGVVTAASSIEQGYIQSNIANTGALHGGGTLSETAYGPFAVYTVTGAKGSMWSLSVANPITPVIVAGSVIQSDPTVLDQAKWNW